MKWITIKKFSDLMGYSENATRAKIKKGVWLMGLHWIKAPDGRVLVNPQAINDWAESR
jgi:hypothetical protein